MPLIAAHALSVNATRVTNNEADFKDYRGRKVENRVSATGTGRARPCSADRKPASRRSAYADKIIRGGDVLVTAREVEALWT